MEGTVTRALRAGNALAVVAAFIAFGFACVAAQDKAPPSRVESPEISLRKSINTRVYQGREVEGEDRQIGRGDSLWRILVNEKGVSGKQFQSYVVIIRGLNPHIKNLEILRVGDKLFIPLRPGQLLESRTAKAALSGRPEPGSGATVNYRIKAGDHLYQILREQLGLTEERKVAQYYALVRDLNPERKNWDVLVEGEIIRLPVTGGPPDLPLLAAPSEPRRNNRPQAAQMETKPAAVPAPLANTNAKSELESASNSAPRTPDRTVLLTAPAKENLPLLARVAESIGGKIERTGEEVINLKQGAVRFDKRNYPVVYNPLLRQRVVLDPDGNIPPSLRTKLADPSIGAPIVTMSAGLSIQDAVSQLLAGLGYQMLPTDRPVIIQEEGVTYTARGDWMALEPEESNKPQQVYVISLSDDGTEVPEYLRDRLGKKGLHFRNILLNSNDAPGRQGDDKGGESFSSPAKIWPMDNRDIVDNFLFVFGIPFGVAETLSVELQNGLRIDAQTDRTFELSGRRFALFFQKIDPEIKKALQDKNGVGTIELEIASLSSREVISRLLTLVGEQSTYREHRFTAARGTTLDRLTVSAWGFHVPRRSLFITDRKIPASLSRFFSAKGLEIVYFH